MERLITYLSVKSIAVAISSEDIRSDVDSIYRLYDLQKVVRFFGQRYWEMETRNDPVRPGELLLETVAAHSFQVAASARWLAPHFPSLDRARTLELALFHDEPEVLTGDRDPVGLDGTGSETHAFNRQKRVEKEIDERVAIDKLAAGMRPSVRESYKGIAEEYLNGATDEAKFVKAVDKLQALAFVRLKKRGLITPDHMAFTIKYVRLGVLSFPGLQYHFQCVLGDVFRDMSGTQADLKYYCDRTCHILENANA